MNERGKEAAGRHAAQYAQDGMVVGLGTGSTADWAIRALAERVAQGLRITAVSSSVKSEELARSLGITVAPFDSVTAVDVTLDGADEVDSLLHLIKGGGGALVREKLVAAASRQMIVVVDETKVVEELGAFPLPVAIFPFGHRMTLERLGRYASPAILRDRDGKPYVTDDGLYIADLHCRAIPKPDVLAAALHAVPGVADVGLFLNLAAKVVVGFEDGRIEEMER